MQPKHSINIRRVWPVLTSFLLLLMLNACALADLRPKEFRGQELTETDQEKGRRLLAEVWKAQGFENFLQHETYTLSLVDHWKGLVGGFSNPWPVNNKEMKLHYEIGTFDAMAEFLEGKKSGLVWGMQSWQTYRQKPGEAPKFKDSHKQGFIFAAVQYFMELPDRLKDLPVVTYMGSRSLNGKEYDLVFASWEGLEPHKEYDQYLLYIDPQTKRLETISYTLRDNYLPAPRGWYGTMNFSDWKTVNGFSYPSRQSIQLNKPKSPKKWIHQIQISKLEFDVLTPGDLDRNPSLPTMGDEKPTR